MKATPSDFENQADLLEENRRLREENARLVEAAAVLRNAAYQAIPRPFPWSVYATNAAQDRWLAEFSAGEGYVRMPTEKVDELHRVLRALPESIQARGVALARERESK